MKSISLLALPCFPWGLRCFYLEVPSTRSSMSREVTLDLLCCSHITVSLIHAQLEPLWPRPSALQAEGHERCFQYSISQTLVLQQALCEGRRATRAHCRIWSKMPEGQQIPDLAVPLPWQPTSKYLGMLLKMLQPCMWTCRYAGTGVPSSQPWVESLSFMGEIKYSQIKPSLPHPVKCLDILDTLLQNAQNAVLLLNCCFSKEGCSAGKFLDWQNLRRSCSTSLSSQVTASASFLSRSVLVFFSIHQDSLLLIQVRYRNITLACAMWRLY